MRLKEKVKYIVCWLVVSAREKSNAEEESVCLGVGGVSSIGEKRVS